MPISLAKKSLGQNFLIAGAIINRIVKALDLKSQDILLEIGPGRGALTEIIAPLVQKLLLIEKDRWLTETLAAKFATLTHVTILNRDFLEMPWQEINTELGNNFKIVSNLPYNVATPILEKLLLHSPPKTSMILMFQKEVAERLMASPRSKAYGSLSIFAQILADVRLVCEVPPKSFRPIPKIDSAVLRFVIRDQPLIPLEDLPDFETLIQSGFAQRRKMLRQNLKRYAPEASSAEIETYLQSIDANPLARAEELTVDQWIRLFKGHLSKPR